MQVPQRKKCRGVTTWNTLPDKKQDLRYHPVFDRKKGKKSLKRRTDRDF